MSTPNPQDRQALESALQAERQRSAHLAERLHALSAELEVLRGAAHDASTSRLLAEEALDDTRSRLALAMEAAQLGLWEWDIHTGHVYVNAQWSTLMGDVALESEYSIQDLMSRIHPDELPILSQHLDAVRLGHEQRYRVVFRIRGFDGHWLWMESHGMGTDLDARGRPARLVGVSADITERQRLQEATEAARREAEAANRSKSEFLANVSHEVRTPLNGVMGLIRLLTDSPLDEQQRQWLQLMDDSSQTLLTLLNDVLDLSKIEAGHMAVEQVRFDLPALVEQTGAPVMAQAAQKPLAVDLDIHPGVPDLVQGDPTRLRQVLTNLLSNAVKFTPAAGQIHLRVRPAANGRVLFEVQDTGIGISQEQQTRVFQAFTQADSSTTRKYGGTGLGLAISAKLVELMGGTLQLESALGKGSRFHFELPLPVASRHAEGQTGPMSAPMELAHLAQVAQHSPTFQGLRVLVAEDHPINELLMRELLKKLGCQTTVARNGLEAIALWKQGGQDLVLMDVQMPELNGLDATAEIRALEASGVRPPDTPHPHTPIVAVTANAMSEDAAMCLSAGMDTYTSKPVSPQALTQAMAQALEAARAWKPQPNHRVPGSHAPSGTADAPRPAKPPPLSLDKLLHRLGGRQEALVHVAHTSAEQLALHMAELASATNQRQQLQATRHAHALKLVLASLTADRAAALCNGLETAAQKGEWALMGRALPVFQSELTRLLAQLRELSGPAASH